MKSPRNYVLLVPRDNLKGISLPDKARDLRNDICSYFKKLKNFLTALNILKITLFLKVNFPITKNSLSETVCSKT